MTRLARGNGHPWLVAIALLAAAAPRSGAAQRPTGVATDTIRVGDTVPIAIRLAVEPGERVVWPDTLPLGAADAENAARVRTGLDTLPDGGLQATAVYTVTPWRTGDVALPDLEVGRVGGDERVARSAVPLPTLTVRSVLPDSGEAQPRPAKGVVGPSWAWTSILLVLLVAAAVLGALVWWLRRRRSEPARVEPAIDPRERALARLEAALEAGLLEQGAMEPFYTQVSHAVRGYLEDLDTAWGNDLTTTEILARFRRTVGPREGSALAELLHPADQVKFARRRPDAPTARAEWERARAWILAFDWPPSVPDHEEAA